MLATALPAPDAIRRGIAKRQWRIARAREDFPEFAPLVVKDHKGLPIDYHAMHLSWCWHLTYCWNRRLHCMIWAHFGSGKSSGFAVPLTTWLLGRDPQLRIKFVANGDEPAAARVEAAKMIIESPEYVEVFPRIKKGRKWNNRAAFVDRVGAALDPSLHARGVETKGVGGRADVIVFDDVVDDINSAEILQRNKVKRAIHAKWMSRLDPERGRVLMIGTPWHTDDAYHEIMAMPGWCCLVQRVGQGLEQYEQEVIGAGPDYVQATQAMALDHARSQADLASL